MVSPSGEWCRKNATEAMEPRLTTVSILVTHLVTTHLVWPHGGPISMRPRA